MDIKHGYYATLQNGDAYETIDIEKDPDGNFTLRSTNHNDLKNGFREYSENVFIKTVPESEIAKIERVRTYAMLKDDPDENKFDIIIKKGTPKNMITLAVAKPALYKAAKNFGFGPCGFGRGTYEKMVSEDEVIIKYEIKPIFLNKSKDAHHLNTKKALEPMDLTVPIHRSPEQSLTKHDQIALAF